MAGKVRFLIQNNSEMVEYLFDYKSIIALVPYASWIKAYNFSKEAFLAGGWDRRYAVCQYIDDYDEYKISEKGTIK